jgi:hypothetical protein
MATESDYLDELFARVVAMQLEALSAYNVSAKPFFFWWQETFPYFTNRLAEDNLDGIAEDYQTDSYIVRMRLVVGHLTEGTPGTLDDNLRTYIPLVNRKFHRNVMLTSAGAYAAPMDILNPLGARLVGVTGLLIFQNAGFAHQQIGCEWTLRCPFTIYTDQEF